MKVSVAIITYNQEKYIAKAIESAVNQDVDFKYEILIGEDCSTDKTRKIVQEYKKKYPQKIVVLAHKKNIGANENFLRTIENCRGKYVAVLEGDDYWVSKKKLQTQVDFLEKNPTYKFSFHLVKKTYEDQKKNDEILPTKENRRDLSLEDFITSNPIVVCSVMFLNNAIGAWPNWIKTIKMCDWPLYLFLLEHGGNAGYINEVMSVYRIHNKGIWSGNSYSSNCMHTVTALKCFNKYFHNRYNKEIQRSIYGYLTSAAVEFYINKKYKLFYFNLIKALIIKISYFSLTKLNFEWFNNLLLIISSRSNFVIKKIIKIVFLIQNFKSSIKKHGIKRSINKVYYYFFGRSRY